MAKPQISTQILRHVINCVELTGRSAAPLLNQFEIASEQLLDRDGTIALATFLALFETAAAYVENPGFGLQAGRLTGSDSLGPLSFVFLSAPTLGEAFGAFTNRLDAMQAESVNKLIVADGTAMFTYGILSPDLGVRVQDAEYSISATFALARSYCNNAFQPTEVCFEHERLSDYAYYREFFGCDVFFEQPSNSMSFAADWLDTPGTMLSAELFPILDDHLRRMTRTPDQKPKDMATQIRQWITRCDASAAIILDDAAKDLQISRSTVQRSLRQAGTSWRDLVLQHRVNAAKRLLTESQRNIADIALSTGYAESASFVRAFQSQTGLTPGAYRKSAGQTRSLT